MNTIATQTAPLHTTTRASGLVASVLALMIGCGIVVLAGHVQAAGLHDAAHDVRHATGFPCH